MLYCFGRSRPRFLPLKARLLLFFLAGRAFAFAAFAAFAAARLSFSLARFLWMTSGWVAAYFANRFLPAALAANFAARSLPAALAANFAARFLPAALAANFAARQLTPREPFNSSFFDVCYVVVSNLVRAW